MPSTACRVVTRAQYRLHVAAHILAYFGFERPDDRPRLRQRAKQMIGQAQSPYYVAVVLARRAVDKPRRRGVGVLVRLDAGQLISKIFGYHQKVGRVVQPTAVRVVAQLIHCVKRLELYTRARIKLGKRHKPVHPLDCVLRAPVAIGMARQYFLVVIYKHIIDAPRVYRKTFDFGILFKRGFDSLDHVIEERFNIPRQLAVSIANAVAEPIHFVRSHFPAVRPTDYVSPARRAYINGKIIFHIPTLRISPQREAKTCAAARLFVCLKYTTISAGLHVFEQICSLY